MEVREIKNGSEKREICERVLRALPDWFALEHAVLDYIQAVASMPMLAAFNGSDFVGFVSIKLHNESSGEVYVMGVLPAYHRSGIGKSLILECEYYLTAHNIQFMTVKTLSPSRKDLFYERTRKFYESMGFQPLEEFKTLWGEANPCLYMVKPLSAESGKRHY